MNDLTPVPESFKYQSIQDAVDCINEGWFLSKVDLSDAYRVVRTHPSNWDYTGLKWAFKGEREPTYMVDTRLPFGASKSPFIFTELSQAVPRIMAEKRFPNIVVYIDDFLIVESSYKRCKKAMTTLM